MVTVQDDRTKVPAQEVDMSGYETEPCQLLTRVDGSVLGFYRSLTDKYAYLPVFMESQEVFNLTAVFQEAMNNGNLSK